MQKQKHTLFDIWLYKINDISSDYIPLTWKLPKHKYVTLLNQWVVPELYYAM